jgi:hypothetical protein
MARKRYTAELWQDEMCVASVDCPTEEDMRREIAHYALVYSQDGPVRIVELPTKSRKSSE